jgi:hypothetical protein
MPIQKCPMCLETKNVVSSHLYPAALYAYCRNPDGESPMQVAGGTVMQTDKQVEDYLLCLKCEGILNKGGETWVNPKLATIQKAFPLYELLMKGPAAYMDDKGGVYYAALNPEIEVERLVHFAMGIFWKAAVHTWTFGRDTVRIELGPYAEPIRLWLRGEGPYPKNMNLALAVARPENALVILTGPVKQSTKRWQSFSLQVPGLLFTLHVGKLIDEEMKDCCFHEVPTHPVFVSDDVMSALWKRVGSYYDESRKTRGYLAAKTRRSAKRKL